MPDKTILTGLSKTQLEEFAESLGEKKFRGRQLFNWIYVRKAATFAEMSDLGKSLRQRLEETADLGCLQVREKSVSTKSGSVKYLFELAGGHLIESVYIPEADRRTLCVSSQAGCALNCAFCATGALGFKRDLHTGEIVDQVIQVEREIAEPLTNIVFMGMGEPFLNYEAAIAAAALMNDADGLAIGHRHIVISTVGITPAIRRYADEMQPYRLAISLHAAIESKRKKLVPISRRYGLTELMEAIRYYAKKLRRRPTFEYVLLAGVNDGEEDARALRQLVEHVPCKVNLIPYNPAVPGYQRPSDEQVQRFADWLAPLQAPVSVRWSKGTDIAAACGQLAGSVVHRSAPSS